jgi:hypothetical protein
VLTWDQMLSVGREPSMEPLAMVAREALGEPAAREMFQRILHDKRIEQRDLAGYLWRIGGR